MENMEISDEETEEPEEPIQPEEESEEAVEPEEEPEDLYKILAEDYPPEIVAPYGQVLVIPSIEFDQDWEGELKDQGCKIYASSLRGHTVMLVKDPHMQALMTNQKKTEQEPEVTALNGTMRGIHKKPKDESSESVKEAEITVTELKNWGGMKRGRKPKSESSETVKEPDITMSALERIPQIRRKWTREEDEIIRRMIEEGHQQKDIAEKLGRTLNSVIARIQIMRGRREGRKIVYAKDTVKEEPSMLKVDSNPKVDPPETNEVFKELLMVAGQLYPNYKSVIRILLNEASKGLGS